MSLKRLRLYLNLNERGNAWDCFQAEVVLEEELDEKQKR